MVLALCCMIGLMGQSSPHSLPPSFLVNLDACYQNPPFLRDLRYATPRNCTGQTLYAPNPEIWLERRTAQALRLVDADLMRYGLRILIWDAYRPLDITRQLYALSPNKKYVAHPEKGSVHNRGCAVDVSLARLDGTPLGMPTDFDGFGYAAAPSYKGGTPEARNHRDWLIQAMANRGFRVNPGEWWHFETPWAYSFPVSNWFPGVDSVHLR